MPHSRFRHLTTLIKKHAAFWPVVGVLGPRQVGKTTLFSRQLEIPQIISLDDLELRTEAEHSPKSFLAKWATPLGIDEVQKAPALFDAMKMVVDRNKRPGMYYLMGSAAFSPKLGIRESLTGRIGLSYLHPMTLAEIHEKDFVAHKGLYRAAGASRFDVETVTRYLLSGGMPVPAFLRSPDQRSLYWDSWLDTTLNRDLPKVYGRSYDPDFAFRLLSSMGKVLLQGELPSLRHFNFPAAKIRKYFSAMEDVYILNRISCHELGASKEVWLPFDVGFAGGLMKTTSGEEATLSLVRVLLWNEWMCQAHYQGKHLDKVYYKSALGDPVDAVIDGIPFKIVSNVTAVTRRLKWEERAVLGAMKTLGAKTGYLVAPVEKAHLVKKGVGILPWGAWS